MTSVVPCASDVVTDILMYAITVWGLLFIQLLCWAVSYHNSLGTILTGQLMARTILLELFTLIVLMPGTTLTLTNVFEWLICTVAFVVFTAIIILFGPKEYTWSIRK